MKKLTLALIYIFVYSLPLAQAQKEDYQWLMGTNTYPNKSGNLLDFNGSVLQISNVANNPANMSDNQSSVCDKNGKLLVYSNGCDIYNRNFQKIYIPQTDPYPFALDDHYTCPYEHYGFATDYNGSMLLPFPNHNNRFVLLHYNLAPWPTDYSDFLLYFNKWLYTEINTSANNELGALETVRGLIKDDSFYLSSSISACRHANGRDWWIISPKLKLGATNGNYYKALLSPTGISEAQPQVVGHKFEHENGAGQSIFSPDGTKFARAVAILGTSMAKIGIYDFDRCTGTLSNERYEEILNDSSYMGGLAFSATSKRLYFNIGSRIYQYNMAATNPLASRQKVYDWRWGDMTEYVNFRQERLAPDGKIYIAHSSSPYLHRINYPDSLGVACGVCIDCIEMPNYSQAALPNIPHFRLGALVGSGCDTLATAVAEIEKEENLFQLSPNPASTELEISTKQIAYGNEVQIYNAIGVAVLTQNLTSEKTTLDVSQLPPDRKSVV